ncbi:histone-like nucleoid-structuring protein Lsr2 [Streptomyces sp. NPDC001508]|uniref:Lsr2 family DNA-binding protein n=1 Tax=Streptomyces sp. NPDC001508 TaxID=3154656 RepID=UPI00332DB070
MKQLGVSHRVVVASRDTFGVPRQTGPGFRYSPERRAENERRAAELMRAGASYDEIKAEVGISAPTILAIRKRADLPASGRTGGGQARTKADGLAASTEPYGDGHVRWTGPMAGRLPQLYAEGRRFNPRHVVFEQHHGRPPEGRVRSNCGERDCIAGAHLTDVVLRRARPKKPVTVRALTNLLDEIDRPGGPQAARDNRLRIPDNYEEPPMATAPAPASAPLAAVPQPDDPAGPLPEEQLLEWADAHPDRDIRDQAARARAALEGLRTRHAADRELTSIIDERERLEQRLADIARREAELNPPKAKGRRASPSYDAATVRAWAKANGIDCPDRGRIPKTVVDAWKNAGSPTTAGGSGG